MDLNTYLDGGIAPTYSTDSSLLNFYASTACAVQPGGIISINFGVRVQLPDHMFLSILLCGSLRRQGLRIDEGQLILTPAHFDAKPIIVTLRNDGDTVMSIDKGSELYHGYIVRSEPITGVVCLK